MVRFAFSFCRRRRADRAGGSVPKAVLPLVTTAHQLLEPRVERDQSENATGFSGLRLTDNEKMSGRA